MLMPAGKKKQKGQGSKKKDTDISTVRLRAATKLLNQRKLLAAMLQDSNEKCKAWFAEHQQLVDKTNDLVSKGVTEDRLLAESDVFGLEDNASVIKMIYAILARSKLLSLLGNGLPGCKDETEMTLDVLNAKLAEEISQDPFMQEQASKMIPWRELSDPEGLYAPCTSPTQIQEVETVHLERISHSKTAVAALKRSMKDCTQMIKSVQKARQRYQDQLARSTQAGSKSGNPSLNGRPNLNNLDKDDPEVLRAWKQINAAYPMKTVQNLVEGEAKMNFPAIIRKGRNTLSMLCGHKDNIKKFFTTCNDAFLSQLEAHLDPTNVCAEDLRRSWLRGSRSFCRCQ